MNGEKERTPVPSGILRDPLHLLALGLGTGCARYAPGTAGTVIGVPVYLAAESLSLLNYVTLVSLGFVAGVWLCGRTARTLGVHDHSAIVWDEVVGFLVTMTAAPPGWGWVLAGFLLFRFLDIVKPWPIRVLDRQVRGGLGIMVDDLAAGLIGLAMLQVIAKVIGL